MSIENILRKDIERREFLKGSGKAVLGLAGLLTACATLSETRQDVAQIAWDCNPILQIPKDKCYTGTNDQVPPFVSRYSTAPDGRMFLTAHPPGEREEEKVINSFLKIYGILPTFNTIGSGLYAAHNNSFPENLCRGAVQKGVIPAIRYVVIPYDNCYRHILKGEFDDKFKGFANKAAEFGHPIVLLPWQCANEPSRRIWEWSGYPSGQYKEAWIRMHNIFQREGANENVIWSTKLISGRWAYETMNDPIPYIPQKEYVDIIGWNCNSNLELATKSGANLSFDAQFRRDYNRAASRYPNKPQMFWELGASRGNDQALWMDTALKRIQTKYPCVKGVMFDVMANAGYDPSHTPETVKVIRKHFASGYYLGSAIKK